MIICPYCKKEGAKIITANSNFKYRGIKMRLFKKKVKKEVGCNHIWKQDKYLIKKGKFILVSELITRTYISDIDEVKLDTKKCMICRERKIQFHLQAVLKLKGKIIKELSSINDDRYKILDENFNEVEFRI